MQLLSGVVSELQFSRGYEDAVFTQRDKRVAGAAAVGAVAMGEIFNSGVLANASVGAEIDVEFFICQVNEKTLMGRFHKVEFKDGEFVDFVVEEDQECFAVLGARSPSQRMIWMVPYHTRGHVAQRRSDLKWSLILSISCASFALLFVYWRLSLAFDSPLWMILAFFFGIALMIFIVMSIVLSRFYGFSKVATQVLGTFGYSSPENTDLNVIHKVTTKALTKEAGHFLPSVSTWSFRY